MPLLTYTNLKQSHPIFDNAMDQGFARKASLDKKFDVFLSHSSINKDLVIDVKNKLHSYGISVYVDWLDDPEIDRRHVTRKTADILRIRMRQCQSLAFLDTEDARTSAWTPWEVGFADANKQRVFIIPIRTDEISYRNYQGREFFSLYPFLDEEPNSKTKKNTLWINSPYLPEHYNTFEYWLKNGEPFTNHIENSIGEKYE